MSSHPAEEAFLDQREPAPTDGDAGTPARYEIEIADEQDILTIDHDLVREVVQQTLAAEAVSAAVISIAFVDDATIHQLNRRYLNHDRPTDVLSFLLAEPTAGGATTNVSGTAEEQTASAEPAGAAGCLEGEVVISTETAQRVAQEYGWRPQDEVVLYLVHGLLHLCGYRDETPSAKAEMRARECALLRRWGLSPRYETR